MPSLLLAALLLLAQDPSAVSVPLDTEALDAGSEAACLRAAALDEARISAPTHFSDELGVEARIVDGRPAQAAAPDARIKLLCLFDRRSGRAETRPFDPDQARTHSRQVRDVWWHAVEMSGGAVADAELLTLSLGGDGRITGRSGCNLYSALYRLDGEALEVVWPMTGTRRACLPAIMDQELRFRGILLNARSLRLQPDGTLLLTDRDGGTLRLARAEARMRPPAAAERD